MNLDWTTIILQLINFLVLMWLLKRLLYRPVLNVINQRQQAIEQAQESARAMQSQAESLQADLQHQADALQQRKTEQLERLVAEVAQERQRQLAALDTEMQEERARQRELAAAKLRNASAQAQDAADRQAFAAISQLMGRLAGPALDDALLNMLLQDLSTLPEAQREQLRQAAQAPQAELEVESAHPLDPARLDTLTTALNTLTGVALPASHQVQPALVSGLRVGLGPWVLAANVSDELCVFRSGVQSAH